MYKKYKKLFFIFFFCTGILMDIPAQNSVVDSNELMVLLGNVDPDVLRLEHKNLSKKESLTLQEKGRLAAMAAGIAQQELKNLDMAKQAAELFAELVVETNDPVLLALHGTAEALVGRDSKSVITKTRSTKKGIAKLNLAAESAETALSRAYVHFLRANVFTMVPRFFKASKLKESALSKCMEAFRELDSDTQYILKDFLAAVYALYALQEEQQGENESAAKFLQKAIQIAPDSYAAEKAQRKLNKGDQR